MNFTIEHVALHLIDKKLDKPQLAKNEINLSAFSQDDQKAIKEFFAGHIDQIWEAEEGGSVRTATFLKSSQIRQQYKEIAGDPTQRFLSNSGAMAQSLYSVTPGNVPAGLLMSLWLRVEKVKRPFLALFKMDPGPADKIVVPSDGKQLLLELAVRHIDDALPDPNSVLKWAITPHPTRGAYDVKIRDFSNPREPAKYFMKFLGCEAKPREMDQINDVFQSLPPGSAAKLLDHIEQSDGVTDIDADTLTAAVQQSGALTAAQSRQILQQIKTGSFRDLDISAQSLKLLRIEYKLDDEITIKGPRAAMEEIKIVPLGKDYYEVRIRANHIEKRYLR